MEGCQTLFHSNYASLPGSNIFGVLLKIRMIKINDLIMKREHFDIKKCQTQMKIILYCSVLGQQGV